MANRLPNMEKTDIILLDDNFTFYFYEIIKEAINNWDLRSYGERMQIKESWKINNV